MQATGFGTDGVVGTLEAVSRLQAVRVDAEAGLLELAAVFRRPARPESLAGSLRESDGLLSGVERGVRVGGVGMNRHGFSAALMWVAALGRGPRSGLARTRLG